MKAKKTMSGLLCWVDRELGWFRRVTREAEDDDEELFGESNLIGCGEFGFWHEYNKGVVCAILKRVRFASFLLPKWARGWQVNFLLTKADCNVFV